MSTYPHRELIPNATIASVCFLLPPGSKMMCSEAKNTEKLFAKKFFLEKKFLLPNSSIHCLWIPQGAFEHCMALILLVDSPSHHWVALFPCGPDWHREFAAREGGVNVTCGGFT